ncbi:hypothetical protein D3C85_1597960 [compost metagenome]
MSVLLVTTSPVALLVRAKLTVAGPDPLVTKPYTVMLSPASTFSSWMYLAEASPLPAE